MFPPPLLVGGLLLIRMSDDSLPSTNPGVYQRIEMRLDRIEDKLDKRLTQLDAKVDGLSSRQDRLEGRLDGVLGIVRWLGPVGLAALVAGLLMIYGFMPKVVG